MKRRPDEVFWQLAEAGYVEQMRSYTSTDDTMLGLVDPDAFIARLQGDARFCSGVFYGLHRSVGNDLVDFRSYNGVLGAGSLQLVIDRKTGAFYADVDRFNPYEDVVRFVGHAGEVIAGFFRHRGGGSPKHTGETT